MAYTVYVADQKWSNSIVDFKHNDYSINFSR